MIAPLATLPTPARVALAAALLCCVGAAVHLAWYLGRQWHLQRREDRAL